MLGRNGNIAYVRYDSHGRIVPGGPIISPYRPKVGFWQPVSLVTGNNVTPNALRAFVRLDAYGRVVPSSLLLLSKEPSNADSGTYWLEINAIYRPPFVPTTTTTTTIHGGVTPTAWITRKGATYWDACNAPSSTIVTYTSINVTPLPPGTPLYIDAALTTRISPDTPVSINGYVYDIVNGYTNPLAIGVPCSNITTSTTTTTI